MDFRDYLEMGEEIAGGRQELAKQLGVQPNNITNAKRGERGLPLASCYKLAELIGAPRDAVAAAAALNTEKDEEVRAYLRPIVQAGHIARHLVVAMGITPIVIAAANKLTELASLTC